MSAYRFKQEISGELGEFWKRSAQKELDDLKKQIMDCSIYPDEQGILRNKGRVVDDECCAKCSYLGIHYDRDATEKERQKEIEKAIMKENSKETSAEELAEMRSVFGKGAKVKNVLSGKGIEL